jgi:indoleamine 2,3-dioxygenase
MTLTSSSSTRVAHAAHALHPERGFLPAKDPLTILPKIYEPWEDLVREIPALLAAGRVRRAVETLPPLDVADLVTPEQTQRAMLLLSSIGHAYVFAAPPAVGRIPAAVAVPWHAVATRLHLPPIMTYASYILTNWRRFDPDGPLELENLCRPAHLTGGIDEDWFGMIHIAIEAQAGPGLHALVQAQDAVKAGDVPGVTAELARLATALAAMLAVLARTNERCDPYIYYHRVRPYLSGWRDNPAFPEGMIYEGVAAYDGVGQFFRGASGAESAIIPAMDDALGIVFNDNPFGEYMHSLRELMPPAHRAFIAAMRERPSIRRFVLRHAATERALADAYNQCIDLMGTFRQQHLGIAATYIHKQSQRDVANSNEIGSGGTPFMAFLKQHVHEVLQHRI